MFQVADVKLIKKVACDSMIIIFVERAQMMVVLDRRICSLNAEEDVLLISNVKAGVVTMRDAMSLRCWSQFVRFAKQESTPSWLITTLRSLM